MKSLRLILCFCIVILLSACTERVTIVSSDNYCEISETYGVLNETDSTNTDINLNILLSDNIPDEAYRRLTDVHNRLNTSNLHIEIFNVEEENQGIVENNIVAYYYANYALIYYNDIGLLATNDEICLIDKQRGIRYSTDMNTNYINAFDLSGLFYEDEGAYIGTGIQELDSVNLLCDVYYVSGIYYKLCYDSYNNLIATGVINEEHNSWYIYKVLTTVQDEGVFELPEYTCVKYDEYLSANGGVDSKFSFLLRDFDKEK